MVRRIGALGVAAAVLVVAACGGDDGGGTSALGGDGSLQTLLATLPPDSLAGDEPAQVFLADFEAARRQLDIEVPESDAGGDEFDDYALRLTGQGEDHAGLPWPEGLGRSSMLTAREDYERQLGISFTEVDGFAEVFTPPRAVTVVAGTFSRDRIADAVTSDAAWNDVLETAEHGGSEYWSWLEDDEIDPDREDQVHQLGESTRLALVDDWLVRSRATADVEATIDTLDGGESLVDDEIVAAVAGGLDDAGAVTGLIVSDAEAFTVEGIAGARATPEGLAELERTTPTLAPYRGLGVGLAFGDGGIEEPFMAIALEHADAEAAADNVERLEQIVRDGESLASGEPWSDVFEIDSIEAAGTTVVARLAIDVPALWPRVVFERDSLLVHD